MRRLPLSARTIERIAAASDRLPSAPPGFNWAAFTFVLGTLGTVLILFRAPLGSDSDRVALAALAGALWCVTTARMPSKPLEASVAGPLGHLLLWWFSGSAVEWGLLDPWSADGPFVLWLVLAGLFAFLCHGRYALLELEESER
jgi:hypothetical protein